MDHYINRVELVGYVGGFKKHEINGKVYGCRFTLCTAKRFDSCDGKTYRIDTTWHTVQSFDNVDDIATAAQPDMKCPVHVIGYIKQVKFTDAEGDERFSYEIVADEVHVYQPAGLFAE